MQHVDKMDADIGRHAAALAPVSYTHLVRLAVYLKAKNAKKYRCGVEYGSARWGRPEDIAPYIDPVPDWNIPLTRTESLLSLIHI